MMFILESIYICIFKSLTILFDRYQMESTAKYLKEQNTGSVENIRQEIKNFRDKRLSEEQQEQTNVMFI